jgi:hypothetical protein
MNQVKGFEEATLHAVRAHAAAAGAPFYFFLALRGQGHAEELGRRQRPTRALRRGLNSSTEG